METPLVSVCMTTYNHEAYLAQAIESVLAQQTSFGVELVLGDDCSTDSTAAICREYAAKYHGRVRFVTGQRNVGWRANYRRTFEACRGKYVAYLDGDDWWCDPRKLQMQADLMESDPGCGMCYTRASNYWQASDRTEPDHSDHYTDFGRLLCSLTIANCITTRFVPRSIPSGRPTTPRCGSGSRCAAASAICPTSRPSTGACPTA